MARMVVVQIQPVVENTISILLRVLEATGGGYRMREAVKDQHCGTSHDSMDPNSLHFRLGAHAKEPLKLVSFM